MYRVPRESGYFLRRILAPIIPTRPQPRRSIVAGSGICEVSPSSARHSSKLAFASKLVPEDPPDLRELELASAVIVAPNWV